MQVELTSVPGDVRLLLGGVDCGVLRQAGPTSLEGVVPPRNLPGLVDVELHSGGRLIASRPKGFRFEPLPAPRIGGIAPNHGPAAGGTIVTLIGSNFVPLSRVTVDGKSPLSVSLDATGSLELWMPPGSAGHLATIRVANPDGQNAELVRGFRYD